MMPQIIFGISFVSGQVLTLLFPAGRWSVLDVTVLLFGGVTLVRAVLYRTRTPPMTLWRPMMYVVAAALLVTALRAALYGVAGLGAECLYIGRWFVYALIYRYLMEEKRDRLSVWRYTLYWSGVSMAVLGLIQLVWYPYLRNLSYLGWDPHLNRVFSTLFDPNFAGIVYVLTLILGASLYVSGRLSSWWGRAGMLITSVALLFTYSRSSFLAAAAAIIIWCIAYRRYALGAALVVVFMLCIAVLPHGGEGQNLFRVASSAARIGSMKIGWDRLMQAPLIGTGFVARPAGNEPATLSRTGGVDTSILYVASSGGVIVLVLYLYMIWQQYGIGVRVLQKHTKDAFLLTSLGAVLVHSIFTNSLLYPWVMAWMWIAVGLVERELTADR